MPAYNFQKRFVPKIRTGIKRHTIRAGRKHGGNAQPGKPLQLYTGMRTKHCEKIIPDPICTAVRPISINVLTAGDYRVATVVLDGRMLTADEVRKLAIADGFADAYEFAAFFVANYPMPANLWLIEWEPHEQNP